VSNSNIDTLLKIIRLGRLKFIVVGFLLYSFGVLLAIASGADFILDRFLLGYSILFTAHLSVSYSNDYFDFYSDQRSKPTTVSGGSGVLSDNPELRKFAKRFALLLISVSIILATIFAILHSFSLPFILFVVFGNLIGWYYTAPPFKLAYRKLGETIATIAVGLMMPGLGYYILKDGFDSLFLFFMLPSIFYSFAFIISVEIPDFEGDKLSNKKTLIVIKGRKFGFRLIALLHSLATTYFLIISVTNLLQSKIRFYLITMLSLIPLTLAILGLTYQSDDREVATRLVSNSLSAFFVFLLLVDFCLIFFLL
jgi:1,4-dihydroxy-2-naphthoate octaprenyltransferase